MSTSSICQLDIHGWGKLLNFINSSNRRPLEEFWFTTKMEKLQLTLHNNMQHVVFLIVTYLRSKNWKTNPEWKSYSKHNITICDMWCFWYSHIWRTNPEWKSYCKHYVTICNMWCFRYSHICGRKICHMWSSRLLWKALAYSLFSIRDVSRFPPCDPRPKSARTSLVSNIIDKI